MNVMRWKQSTDKTCTPGGGGWLTIRLTTKEDVVMAIAVIKSRPYVTVAFHSLLWYFLRLSINMNCHSLSDLPGFAVEHIVAINILYRSLVAS